MPNRNNADIGSLLSKYDLEFLARAEAIDQENAKNVGTIGFMARALIQATLPHSKPETNEFCRKNGKYSLVMLAPSGIGLPYGSMPRLILSWISTEAVRTKEPVVKLGASLSAFMRELDIVPTGGRWGTIPRVKEQMKRLLSTSISCNFEDPEQWASSGFRIADGANLWWHPQKPDEAGFWESNVTLGNKFFRELVDHPVPVDMRALRALRRSPLALDIYCWLTFRLSYLRKTTKISWPALAAQFGADYSRADNFKAAFIAALRKVSVVYNAIRVEPTTTGLLLKPANTHVERR
jgi:hypothetical protein